MKICIIGLQILFCKFHFEKVAVTSHHRHIQSCANDAMHCMYVVPVWSMPSCLHKSHVHEYESCRQSQRRHIVTQSACIASHKFQRIRQVAPHRLTSSWDTTAATCARGAKSVVYDYQCRIMVGAIDAEALGPFKKQAHGHGRENEKSLLYLGCDFSGLYNFEKII